MRTKTLLVLFILFFFYLAYGLFLSQTKLYITDPVLNSRINYKYYDYKGITHTHSLNGIGSGSVEEIAAKAKLAGLDFLFITDINPYKEPKAYEGYDDQLLIMQGGRYSYLDSTLLFYPRESYKLLFKDLTQAQTYFTDMLSQDKPESFLVLTSPASASNSWLERSGQGLSGLEVINLKRLWRESWRSNKWQFLLSLLIYPFHSDYSMIRLYNPPTEDLHIWDELNQKRLTAGFLGNDISAKSRFLGSNYYLRFPSYFSSFKFASNHVLTPTELTGLYHKDKDKILSALRAGSFYMCFDVLGDPKGFYVEMSDGKHSHTMGSEISLTKDLTLNVHLPGTLKGKYAIQVLKNGQVFTETNQLQSSVKIHLPGIYRVQVKVRSVLPFPDQGQWLDWIYTNSFRVIE